MKKLVRNIIYGFIFLLICFFCVFNNETTYAKTEVPTDILDKAILNGVLKCYENGYIKDSFSLNDYNGIGSLLSSKVSDNDYVPLITGIDSIWSLSTSARYQVDSLSCNNMLKGNSEARPLLNAMDKGTDPDRSNTMAVKDFLENMGYTVSSGSSDRCFSLRYYIGEEARQIRETNLVCQDSTGSLYAQDKGNLHDGGRLFFEVDGNKVCLKKESLYNPHNVQCNKLSGDELNGDFLLSLAMKNGEQGPITDGDPPTWFWAQVDYNGAVDHSDTGSLNNYVASFVGDSSRSAGLKAINYLSGGKYQTADSVFLTEIEKRLLYQAYLETYYNVTVDCSSSSPYSTKIRWLDTTDFKMKDCGYNTSGAKNKNKAVNGVVGGIIIDKDTLLNPIKNMQDLLDAFENVLPSDYSEEELENAQDVISHGNESDKYGSASGDKCRESGAGKSLGWFLCPILNLMSDAATNTYNDYISPLLSIDPEILGNNNSSSGTYTAWETFRNIADIVFIILFLVVIFSQLTGVGIDNYGIKKIMPKLIVAAILINLSYLICIILVDLSDIVGNAVQGLFDNMAESLTVNGTVAYGGEGTAKGIVSVALAGGIAAGAIWAVIANPAVLLSLLVSVLGLLISMFFLFILLAGRKAAVVVMVVIAPLAVVCYMLPNTKKFFDKWWKLFTGLLLVYPIAGLLVGGGNYVSKLILAVNGSDIGIVEAITAMVIGILPIFFIPTVLKSSFAAMGKVGSMVSGLGDRAKGAATKKMRSSEGYKNAQTRGLERKIRMKAGIDARTGELNKRGKLKARFAGTALGRGLGYDKLQATRAQRAKKDINEKGDAMAVLGGLMATSELNSDENKAFYGFDDKTEGALYSKKFDEAARKGDRREMDAVIKEMKNSNMKDKDVSKVVRTAINNGALDGMSDENRAAWMRSLYKNYGNDFLATDYELNHFLRSGGSNNKGKLGNYGEYAAAAPIELDELRKEDFLRLSGDSLAAMIGSGKLTQSMARQILAMRPNLSEDKMIMIGAAADGAVGTSAFSPTIGTRIDKNGNRIQYKVPNKDKISQFKQDAVAAANAEKGEQMSLLGVSISDSQKSKWTRPAANSVTIDQQEWNTVPVHVESNGRGIPQPSPEELRLGFEERQAATQGRIMYEDMMDQRGNEQVIKVRREPSQGGNEQEVVVRERPQAGSPQEIDVVGEKPQVSIDRIEFEQNGNNPISSKTITVNSGEGKSENVIVNEEPKSFNVVGSDTTYVDGGTSRTGEVKVNVENNSENETPELRVGHTNDTPVAQGSNAAIPEQKLTESQAQNKIITGKPENIERMTREAKSQFDRSQQGNPNWPGNRR